MVQLQQAVEKSLQTRRAWFLGATSDCWEIYFYGIGMRLKNSKQSEEFSKSLSNIKAAVVSISSMDNIPQKLSDQTSQLLPCHACG